MRLRRLLAPVLGLAVVAAVVSFPARGGVAPDSEDVAAVRRAALDYVEALYEVEPELIERSVSPDLVKLGYHRREAGAEYVELKMTFDELRDLAASWNEKGWVPADAPKEVEVLHLMDKIASVRLVGLWGTDYMHLVKTDGRWQTVQVLWQSPPLDPSAPAD